MGTQTLARPEHIDPRRWNAASWHARSRAVAAARRAEAEAAHAAEEANERAEMDAALEAAAQLRAGKGGPVERAEVVVRLLELGVPPEDIVTHVGVTPGAIAQSLRRRGHVELARPFNRMANWRRHDRCQCGQTKQARSKQCTGCAAKFRNLTRRPTERTAS
jgi:hypothetical protein